MYYYQFTTWEPQPIEEVLQAKVPQAIAKADGGDLNPLKEIYEKTAISSHNMLKGTYRLGGWEFNLKPYCKRYLVNIKHCGWEEYYAPSKTCLYNAISKSQIIEMHEFSLPKPNFL